LVDGFDGGLAAEAATGAGENVAGEFVVIDENGRGDKNVDDVAELGGCAGLAVGDFENVRAIFEKAFGDKKAAGQFIIVPGSAHGDGDALAADANLKGFFAGEEIFFGAEWFAGAKARNGGGDEEFGIRIGLQIRGWDHNFSMVTRVL
jgi:hypothetical protein